LIEIVENLWDCVLPAEVIVFDWTRAAAIFALDSDEDAYVARMRLWAGLEVGHPLLSRPVVERYYKEILL
jgi:hypothetical protein